MKVVYGFSYFASEYYDDAKKMVDGYVDHLRQNGFDIEAYCLTLNPPGGPLSFPELDRRWRAKDPELLKFYDDLRQFCEGKDVLLNASGINLHPEFVESLDIFTVFQCFDDPESSDNLSKPVAKSYDMCLVGNIAEVETYKSWGVKYAEWVPMGVLPEIYDPSLTEEQILTGKRDIDLFMMINYTPWRKERLDKLAAAFPKAHFFGVGWPRGVLTKERDSYLRRAKIGPNLHNSTGPINYRTFYLPANGIMQICDNKSHLGKIFELNKEVVGYDKIEECIDLCRYYLAHDDERRQIAVAGWKRCLNDYTEVAIFQRNIRLFEKYMRLKSESEKSFLHKVKVQIMRIVNG